MDDIFNHILDRVYNHVIPKTKNLRVENEPTFEGEMTPFQFGMKIESFFMFHIYLLNFNSAIHRFDTRTRCVNGEPVRIGARINGVPLSQRKDVEFNYEIPIPSSYSDLLRNKNIAKNWIIPLVSVIKEMRLFKSIPLSGDIDTILIGHYNSNDYDKNLRLHFLRAQNKFRCKKRCLLKPKFISTYPDIVIDDTIIDIKTNIGFSELRNQCAQLLNQFIDFYAFRNFSNVVYHKDISDFEKNKILLPIKKLCLYYYRYDKFFTIDLMKLTSKEEFNQLVAVKRKYSRIIF